MLNDNELSLSKKFYILIKNLNNKINSEELPSGINIHVLKIHYIEEKKYNIIELINNKEVKKKLDIQNKWINISNTKIEFSKLPKLPLILNKPNKILMLTFMNIIKKEINCSFIFNLIGYLASIKKITIFQKKDSYSCLIEFTSEKESTKIKNFLEDLNKQISNYTLNIYYSKKKYIQINEINDFNYDIKKNKNKNLFNFNLDYNHLNRDYEEILNNYKNCYCLYLISDKMLDIKYILKEIINYFPNIRVKLESNLNNKKIILLFNKKGDIYKINKFINGHCLNKDLINCIKPTISNYLFNYYFLFGEDLKKLYNIINTKFLNDEEKIIILNKLLYIENNKPKNEWEIKNNKFYEIKTPNNVLIIKNNTNIYELYKHFNEKNNKFKINFFFKINSKNHHIIVFNKNLSLNDINMLKSNIIYCNSSNNMSIEFLNQNYYNKLLRKKPNLVNIINNNVN